MRGDLIDDPLRFVKTVPAQEESRFAEFFTNRAVGFGLLSQTRLGLLGGHRAPAGLSLANEQIQ